MMSVLVCDTAAAIVKVQGRGFFSAQAFAYITIAKHILLMVTTRYIHIKKYMAMTKFLEFN